MNRHPVAVVFAIALSVRVFAVFLIPQIFDQALALDDSTYSDMAAAAAEGDTGSWDAYTRTLYHITATLLLPLTAIYRITGESQIAGQIFVATFGAATAALATRVALEFLDRKRALLVGLAIAFFPSQIAWSTLILKDALVWAALACIAVLVALAGRSSGRALLAALGGLAVIFVLLGFLRGHTLVVAGWAALLASAFGMRSELRTRVGSMGVLALSIPWVLGFGPGGLTLVTAAGSLTEKRALNAQFAQSAVVEPAPALDIEKLLAIEEQTSELKEHVRVLVTQISGLAPSDRPQVKEELEVLKKEISTLESAAHELRKEAAEEFDPGESLKSDLAHLPRGISVMLFEPYPWQTSTSTSFQLARAESVLWYPMLLLAGIGLIAARRALRVITFPVVAGAGILLVYALSEGNVGTAFRHRGEFVWVVLLLAGAGVAKLQGKAITT